MRGGVPMSPLFAQFCEQVVRRVFYEYELS